MWVHLQYCRQCPVPRGCIMGPTWWYNYVNIQEGCCSLGSPWVDGLKGQHPAGVKLHSGESGCG